MPTFSYAISDVLTALTSVYGLVVGMFSNVINTITGNPLLYVPVLFALLGGVIMFAIGVIRKLGVRGVSSGGKRRRGYR